MVVVFFYFRRSSSWGQKISTMVRQKRVDESGLNDFNVWVGQKKEDHQANPYPKGKSLKSKIIFFLYFSYYSIFANIGRP